MEGNGDALLLLVEETKPLLFWPLWCLDHRREVKENMEREKSKIYTNKQKMSTN